METNIFFTSDLHFGHSAILNFCPCFRNYRNTDEMDRGLIDMWNSTVGVNDEVYNLGDYSFHKDIERTITISKKLKGKHTLILGNHDSKIRDNVDRLLTEVKDDGNRLFENIYHYHEKSVRYKDEKLKLIMFHYPILEWNSGHRGSIHLYGHVHDNLSDLKGRALNVGYDLHGKIIHLRDVISYTKHLEPFIHHGDKLFGSNDTAVSRSEKIRNHLNRL